jgi:uncharacterized protein YndB with AHSA1/START domain
MRILFTILVVIIAAYFALCFAGKEKITFSESKTINAPIAKVWDMISDFKNSYQWSPWQRQDSTLQVTTSEPSFGLNSRQSWKGKKMGEGNQVITIYDSLKTLTTKIEFKDFKSFSEGKFDFTTNPDSSTTVTWSYSDITPTPFYMRGVMKLMNIESGLKADYQKGLHNIDSVCTLP